MVFESLLAYSRSFGDSVSGRREASLLGSGAIALDGFQGDVYAEETFRHFLGIDCLRAARSDREVLLLLVSLRRCPERGVRFSSGLAATLLNGLGLCVRDVDFIGWYRHERVAGAVLTQGVEGPDSQAPSRIIARVFRVLRERLPQRAVDRLRVRVVRLRAQAQ